MRLHPGSETQSAYPLIVAKEGAQNAPAYRGLAYVVFERLPLADFGNRVPQFSFEVVRPVDGLNRMIRAVCLVPGASEFGYDTLPVMQVLDLGKTRPENRHQMHSDTDVAASLDALQALCPNLRRVSLVVSWFGDDLRAGSCLIEPRGDVKTKTTDGAAWSVAGLTRQDAKAVSLVDGAPAYGGTPSDESVIRLIRNLKARGLEVVLYPFVMMDVPIGNDLPDPYGGTGQSPYPWRGRITCHPAPGRSGSPDGTGAAATQIEQWFTRSAGFNRMVLHYADLAERASGVHGFILGSELVGLTRVRSSSGVYPAVTKLKALAGQVRAILRSSTRIVYAADWTEYGAHVLDGGDEVRFPLDPLSPATTSMRSGSTTTRRSRIGATAPTTRTCLRRAASTTWITCARGWGAARRSIGTTPMPPSGRRRRAGPSPMAPTTSRGSSARRISSPGGRTGMRSA
jgi:hypothetical protein